MPEGTIYVGRPTIYGNPFPVNVYGQEGAVERFKRLIAGNMSAGEMADATLAIEGSLPFWRKLALSSLKKLRGKDLACWCPILDAKTGIRVPCHADVLLELANR